MPTVLPGGVLAANPTCQNVGIGNGPAKVTFVNAGVPRARWSTRDGLSNDSIYGLWYKINDGSGPVDIVDNQALDLDKRPGMYEVSVATNGTTLSVCPILAPVGRVLGNQSKGCVSKR